MLGDVPAFPTPSAFGGSHEGMTLRDYFAGQALVALPNVGCGADLELYELVLASYQVADAMIAARKGGEA